ncbi:hypothetical protein EDD17DRAFT_1107732 [Pisolithus thermaeus]|nr:hypothetical protein EDD17DRAFT_1107732 [Pisolithus thermaeus]
MVKPKKSISLASEVKFTSDSFLPAPAPDFQEKVKHVKEVYKTTFDDPSSEPATVPFTLPDRTRNQSQDGTNSSRRTTAKSFATEDVGEPHGLKQGEDNPIRKNSFVPHSDSGDQVPQEDLYSTILKNRRSGGEQNCEALVFSNTTSGKTRRTRSLKRVRTSNNDVATTGRTCGIKKSASPELDVNDAGETRASITRLNGQSSKITAQPGTDIDSGVFGADEYAMGLQVNTDTETHHAPISTIASHSPIIQGKSEDNRQDVGRKAIETSRVARSEDTKQSLTLPKDRASEQSPSSAWSATRPRKRKMQEVTRCSNTTHAGAHDEEDGSHRKSRKRVGRVPPSNRRATRSRPMPLDPANTPKLDAAIINDVDGFSKISSTTSPPVVFDETTRELEEKPCRTSVDAGFNQGLIPVNTGAPSVAIEKAGSRPKPEPNPVSSPKRSDSVMREETTGVATISDTPSAPATMSVAVTATSDSTTVPRAQRVRSQLSSSELVILDEVFVDITGFNEAETKGGRKHGHHKLEEVRSHESSILDGPSQDTGGKPNEPIFIPGLTPRPSGPECSNVGDFFSETVPSRETGPNLGSFASAGDDTAGPSLTAGCLVQPISDEDINKAGLVHRIIVLKFSLRFRWCYSRSREGPEYYWPYSEQKSRVAAVKRT